MSSSSWLTLSAHWGPSSGLRKSSQGFASEMTEVAMLCVFINASFWSVDEYDESMGRPR